ALPELVVRPSLRALLRGRIAVGRIGLSGMRLTLVRDAEGAVRLGEEAASGGKGPGQILSALVARGPREGAAGYLSRVDVRGAHLELDDHASETRWLADDSELSMSRSPDGLIVRLRGELRLGHGTFATLRELALNLSATTVVSVTADGSIARLAFEGRGENGWIAPAGDSGATMPVHSLEAQATYSADSRTLEVQSLRAAVGSSRLDSNGSLSLDGALVGEGQLRSLPVSELRRLWPRGFADATREWISRNIESGVVPSCRFALRLPSRAEGAGPLPDDAVDVRFEFDRLVVHYLRPLDPLRAVRGSASLTAGRFDAQVESAESGTVRVHRGRMEVDLRARPAATKITADVQGPTGELLALLDRPPLGVVQRLGISSRGASGSSDVEVKLRLPLTAGLTLEDVDVAAVAELREASAPDLFGGIGIEKGRLRVRVAEGRFEIEGDTAVTGAPALSGPVRVALSSEPREGGVRHVRAVLEGRDLHAEGEAEFEAGVVRTLSLHRFRLDRNDVSAELVRQPTGRYHASLEGESVDLEPLRERWRSRDRTAPRFAAPWSVDFDVARALAGGGFELSQVRGHAAGEGESLQTLGATAAVAGGGSARMYLARRDGGRSLRVTSDRAGELLEQVGVFENAAGGELSLAATIDDPTSRVEGVLEVSDFRVVRAPVLARVLSLGSLEGIAELLEGEGIAFTRARFPFVWSDDRIDVREARALGSIGLTADGAVYPGGGRIDLAGNVIPAYTLNSALGKLPFFGELLVGGKGEGVFGIAYRVSGKLDEPEIHVNPLSSLAPGRLRKMFFDPFRPSRGRDLRSRG
ncbi:MAG: AsmA-like C-terminal region-containing protein, partial [Candidatus Binatia bacterium]